MSWSISMIGKPTAIAAALDEEAAKLDGQSRIESPKKEVAILSLCCVSTRAEAATVGMASSCIAALPFV